MTMLLKESGPKVMRCIVLGRFGLLPAELPSAFVLTLDNTGRI